MCSFAFIASAAVCAWFAFSTGLPTTVVVFARFAFVLCLLLAAICYVAARLSAKEGGRE